MLQLAFQNRELQFLVEIVNYRKYLLRTNGISNIFSATQQTAVQINETGHNNNECGSHKSCALRKTQGGL